MSRIVYLLIFFVTTNSYAEIYKLAIPTDSGIKFYWWPVLPDVSGWHHDRGSSIRYAINAQAIDGSTFTDSETVIYANAVFKPRVPEFDSLKKFIEYDQKQFKKINYQIQEEEPIYTGDGKKIISYSFCPKGEGNWERVSYGEEGDFYLVFTLSSRSKEGYKKYLRDYKIFIGKYKEYPNK